MFRLDHRYDYHHKKSLSVAKCYYNDLVINKWSRNQPINVFGSQPFLKHPWITFMEPLQNDDYVVLGNASRNFPGVYIYSAQQQKTFHLSNFSEKVWDGKLDKDCRLLVAQDDGVVTLTALKLGHHDVQVANCFDFELNITNNQIDQVGFVPERDDCFVTRDDQSVKLWRGGGRVANCLQNIVSVIDKDKRICSFEWNNREGNLLACSIKNEGMSLYDVRINGQHAVRKYTTIMDSTYFTKTKWNPFVPYWIAAASEWEINVFDLRYESSSPMMSFPASFTHDFSWSNSNCELLLSGSSSRNLSLWSMIKGNEDLFSISCAEYGGNIAKLVVSSQKPNVFYGLSLLGSIVSLEIKQDFLRSIVPLSVIPTKESSLEKLECALYCRDFVAVFEELLKYSNSATPSNFNVLHNLTNKTLPMLPISSDSWAFNNLSDGGKAFFSDIEKFCNGIPPGFNLDIIEQSRGSLKDAIEGVRFKVRLLEALQNQDSVILGKMADEIIDTLRTNPSFLDVETLLSINQTYLISDKIAALKFGRRIIELGGKKCVDTGVCSIIHLLLYPTIFDSEVMMVLDSSMIDSPNQTTVFEKTKSNDCRDDASPVIVPLPTAQPNRSTTSVKRRIPPLSGQVFVGIRKFLRSVNHVLSMIDLEIMIEEASDMSTKQKIILEEIQADRRTISAKLIFNFLELLLERSQFDSYFLQLCKFCSQPRTEFSYMLLEHMDKRALPKLKYILAQAIDTHRPSLVVKAILLIAIIVNGLNPLPDGLEPFLTDRLRRLIRAMRGEDYSSMNGYPHLVNFINAMQIPPNENGIWGQIALLQRHLH